MDSIDVLKKDFKARHESVLSGCDAIEEFGGWGKEDRRKSGWGWVGGGGLMK